MSDREAWHALSRVHGLARTICVLAKNGTELHACAIELRDLVASMVPKDAPYPQQVVEPTYEMRCAAANFFDAYRTDDDNVPTVSFMGYATEPDKLLDSDVIVEVRDRISALIAQQTHELVEKLDYMARNYNDLERARDCLKRQKAEMQDLAERIANVDCSDDSHHRSGLGLVGEEAGSGPQ